MKDHSTRIFTFIDETERHLRHLSAERQMALRRGAICLLRHLQEADGDSFDVAPSVRHVEAVAIYEQRWRLEQNGDLMLCFSFQTPSSFIGRLRGMRHHAHFPMATGLAG